MKNLKIGFIGCGKHAKANIYPSVRLLGVDINSVCAKHLDRAKATAREFHAAGAYDNYITMLEEEQLDAVFVIAPGEQHPKIVEDCLKAGVNVFVEKPLGWNAKEAQKVADLSRQVRKHVMVGFMKRFAPSYVEMKRIMNQKDFFGEVLSMTGMFGIRSFGRGDDQFLKYGAIHFVDLIRFFVGEVKHLSGFSNTKEQDIDNVFSFSTENGRIGNMFFAGLPAWARHYEEVTITGTQGFVKVENMTKVVYYQAPKELKTTVPRWQVLDEEDRVITSISTSSSGGLKDLYTNGYVGEIQHFLQCVANNQEPSSSAADNVKTMTLCDKIIESFSGKR